MKPFRFAWNDDVYSKRDTYTILGTFLVALLALLAVVFTLCFLKLC